MGHMKEKAIRRDRDEIERVFIDAFIESIDPDWKDHFLTVDDAFRHYKKFMTPREFNRAVKELLL